MKTVLTLTFNRLVYLMAVVALLAGTVVVSLPAVPSAALSADEQIDTIGLRSVTQPRTRNVTVFDSPVATPTPEPTLEPTPVSQDGRVPGTRLTAGRSLTATQAIIDARGGRLRSADRRIQLDVPPGLFARAARLSITPRAADAVDDGPGGMLLRFDLDAQDAGNGQVLEAFAQPITLTIDLRGLTDVAEGRRWYVAQRDPQDPTRWHRVETMIVDPAGLLVARLEHFSPYASGSEPGTWHYSWQPPTISAFSGAATFNYPIEVPPGRSGLAPNVDVTYSSRGVDGHILSNMDQGPLGLGWSIGQIEITRDGLHFWDDGGVLHMIHPDVFSLVFNGTSHSLKPEAGANTTTWNVVRYYAEGAPQLLVQRIYDAAAAGANPDKFYWLVKGPDGTTYRVGYTPDAESGQTSWPGHPWVSGHPGADSTYSGIRWRVDTVTDVHGNQMQYTYSAWSQDDHYTSNVGSGYRVTSGVRRLAEVRYNYAARAPNATTRVSGSYASKVVLESGYDVLTIKVYHVDLGTPVRQIRIGLGSTWNNTCGQSVMTGYVKWIQEYNGAGTLARPATTFTYSPKDHGKPGGGCFKYEYVVEVNNGYGGRIAFSYGTDLRRDTSGGTDNPNFIPSFGQSYFVTRSETWDGVNTAPAITDYQYETPCYDQQDGDRGYLYNAWNCPIHDGIPDVEYGHSPLIGFARTTITTKDYNGAILGKAVLEFHQDRNRLGRAWREQALDANNTLLTQTDNFYFTQANGATTFTYLNRTDETTYASGTSLTKRTTFAYDPYGNQTAVYDHGNNVAGDERSVHRGMNYNLTAWLVNRVAFENAYEEGITGNGGGQALKTQTHTVYDNAATYQGQVTKGLVTRIDRGGAGGSWVSTGMAYDAWGNPTVVTDTRGFTTTTVYDTQYRLYPLQVRNAKGQTTQYQYYGVNGVAADGNPIGLLKSTIDPNGATTTYKYDGFGRLLKVIRPGDSDASPTTRYEYRDPYPWLVVPNNSFEAGSANWQLFWEPTPASVVTDDRYSGASSLRLQGGSNGGAFQDIGGLTPGRVYQVRVFVKASAGATAKFNLWLHDTAGGNPVQPAATTPGTTWSQVSALYTANTTGRVRIHLYYTAGSGAIYVDDVWIGSLLEVGTYAKETGSNTHWTREVIDGLGRTVQTQSEKDNDQAIVVDQQYDARGLLSVQTMPVELTSAPDGLKYLTPDWTRPRTTTTHDSLGRPLVVTAPDGTTTTHSYGFDTSTGAGGTPTNLWREAVADANQHGKHFVTDAYGRLVLARELDGTVVPRPVLGETKYAYDVLGNLTRVTDALGNTTVITYNTLSQKTAMIDPDMGAWKYEYDPAGNLITQTDALNNALWFKYDPLNRLIEKRQTNSSGALLASYTYDTGTNGTGRRTRMDDPSGWTTWTYDARGRVVNETKVITVNTAANTFVTSYGYDAMDRVTSTTYPTGEVVTQTYNLASQLTQLRSTTYGLNYASGMMYNALGQLTEAWYGNGVNVRYGYRGLGGQWDSEPSGGLTSFGLLYRIRARNSAGLPLLDKRYAYDNVGNVTRLKDAPERADNWPTTYTFQDAFNTKDTNNWTWNSYQTVPFNDGGNNVVKSSGTNANWDGNFYRTGYTPTTGKGLQLRFKVDATNTAAHFSIEANDTTYRRFGVIADGGKLYVQHNDGSGWRSPADLLTNLQVNTWYVVRIVVDDSGRGFYVEAYQESNPSVRGSFNVWLPTGKAWRFRHWLYRGTAYIDDYREFSTSGLAWVSDERLQFTYDALDRLLSASPENGAQGYTQSYGYNAIGNIISTTMLGAYTYNAVVSESGCVAGTPAIKPHAVSQAGSNNYVYDCNGNMVKRIENGVMYNQQWTAENRVDTITGNGQSVQYIYDGDGNRVKKIQNGVTTIYVGALYEKNLNTSEVTTYYFAGAQRVAMRKGSSLYYLVGDHLGSTSLTLDASGNKIGEMKYTPYGETRYEWGGTPTDRRFTGQRQEDSGLGSLYDFQARFYSPALGRFLSADTIVPNPNNPQSLNRLSYVRNNPLKYIDPTGYCEFTYDVDGKRIGIKTFNCSLEKFNTLTWEERIDWVRFFQEDTLVGKFDNIIGILSYFATDRIFSTSGWAKLSDAGVLLAINDGWRLYTASQDSAGGTANFQSETGSVADLWRDFFAAEKTDDPTAFSKWGIAEQAGIDYGMKIAEPLAGKSGGFEELLRIGLFVTAGNIYRAAISNDVQMPLVTTPENSGSFAFLGSSLIVSPISDGLYDLMPVGIHLFDRLLFQ